MDKLKLRRRSARCGNRWRNEGESEVISAVQDIDLSGRELQLVTNKKFLFDLHSREEPHLSVLGECSLSSCVSIGGDVVVRRAVEKHLHESAGTYVELSHRQRELCPELTDLIDCGSQDSTKCQ
jgi:hypothetical protein